VTGLAEKEEGQIIILGIKAMWPRANHCKNPNLHSVRYFERPLSYSSSRQLWKKTPYKDSCFSLLQPPGYKSKGIMSSLYYCIQYLLPFSGERLNSLTH
jgi:hypothetical protein